MVNTHRVLRTVKKGSFDAPRMSIVIPSFNTSRFAREAVRSALGQSIGAVEVIVVDDGSTDDTLSRVLEIDDPRLTVLAQTNCGPSAARNRGIAMASAPFIGFLDSDDVWHPRKAEAQLERMGQDRRIGLTFSYSAYIDEQGRPVQGLLRSPKHHPTAREMVKRNHLGNGSNAILRRECFAQAGVFDESLRFCEDWEFWVRVAGKSDYSFALVPEVLTAYRLRRDSAMMTDTAMDRLAFDGENAIRKFTLSVPDLQTKALDRSCAQLYRVMSWRALSRGSVHSFKDYFSKALSFNRTLIFCDVRAAVLLPFFLVSLVWPKLARRAYWLVRSGQKAAGSNAGYSWVSRMRELGKGN